MQAHLELENTAKKKRAGEYDIQMTEYNEPYSTTHINEEVEQEEQTELIKTYLKQIINEELSDEILEQCYNELMD